MDTTQILIIAAVVAVVCLALILFFWLRKGKKPAASTPVKRPVQPKPDAPTWDDAFGDEQAEKREFDPQTLKTDQAAPVPAVSPAETAPTTAATLSSAPVTTEVDESAAVEAADDEQPESSQAAAEGGGAEAAAVPAAEPSVEPVAAPAPAAESVAVEADTADVTEADATVATESDPAVATETDLETPEAPEDRFVRLKERLVKSGSLGRGLVNLLARDRVDEDTWDELEEDLLMADLGPDLTDELMANLKQRMKVLGGEGSAEQVQEVVREELIKLVNPEMNRRLASRPVASQNGEMVPAVVMMVGVNGTGKTTTAGKLGRVYVAQGRKVVLGAADTFRAAAAEQLQTWGERTGIETVRADRDGADPAAVAFDAVHRGVSTGADVVIIDTAGRLQNKKGLMDELGKIRRVSEKALGGAEVQEVLLVLDATTGQNGMQQARVFAEVVDVTGIALTKLDGTAKGGIVMNVQQELGVPVKLVGLGEGLDDLTPFDPYGFVDALLEG